MGVKILKTDSQHKIQTPKLINPTNTYKHCLLLLLNLERCPILSPTTVHLSCHYFGGLPSTLLVFSFWSSVSKRQSLPTRVSLGMRVIVVVVVGGGWWGMTKPGGGKEIPSSLPLAHSQCRET
ncbi:hypothetical protein M0802_011809 [Mischocyttarus mexicanus]|nr:hypothetical protein M0802_011809 [Mischocyttarus mexicanus]